MVQTALLTTVSRAANKQSRVNHKLLADMAAKAADTAKQKEIARRYKLRRELDQQHRIASRVRLALQGVDALCALGSSPQFEELIKVRGKSLTVWGGKKIISPGYDMADIHWKWVSMIELRATELVLYNYTASSGNHGSTFTIDRFGDAPPPLVHFPYALDDELLRTRHLWRIATTDAIEELDEDTPEFYKKERESVNFVYSTELLFETLVMCANPKEFTRLIRNAIR